jgi:hypothetical protein
MAITVRKEIADQMEYLLAQISGLVTVTLRRDTDAEPYDPSECPALNIKPGDGTITHNVSNDEHALKVSLELHTTSRTDSDDVESLLGDVTEKIAANETWGTCADGTNIEHHGVDTNQIGDVIASGTLEITVNYTTEKGKI